MYYLAWVCGDIGGYQCALVLLLKVLAADQCEHLHIPFVYGERAYLKLGLRHGMWIFL